MPSRCMGLGHERRGRCISPGNVPGLFPTALRCAEPVAPGPGSTRRRSPLGGAVLGGQQVVLGRLPPPRPVRGARQNPRGSDTTSADARC